MKIECKECEEKYIVSRANNTCPECGATGGYSQVPATKNFINMQLHLGETLVHTTTGGEFKVKEIQKNGMITEVAKSIAVAPGGRAYISNDTIQEYSKKQM